MGLVRHRSRNEQLIEHLHNLLDTIVEECPDTIERLRFLLGYFLVSRTK